MSSARVAEHLREIGRYLRVLEPSSYRGRAYERGGLAIAGVQDLDRLVRQGRLGELPGIGDSLARLVAEVHETGTSRYLERLRAEVPPAVIELASVRGISLKRARRLHEELGIETVQGLIEACRGERVRTLGGIGSKVEARLLEAALAHLARSERTILQDGLRAAEQLRVWLLQGGVASRCEIAGSLRRRCEIVTEISLVACARDAEAVFARLVAHPSVMAPSSRDAGPPRMVDGLAIALAIGEPDRFGTTLFHATGPADHVAAVERRREARSVSLRDARAADEALVYAAAGLPFIPPELRDDPDVLQMADAGDDFSDLVALDDIRGAVHCHTTDSDGRASVADMAAAAAARGFSYLTITDHSSAAHYAGGLDAARLAEQRQVIEAARRAMGPELRIFAGTESDILPDGSLDFSAEVLASLDVVIASIHARHGQDEDAMTARLVACMRSPIRKIWGHPLGRLLLLRDPIAVRLDEVLEAAAVSGAIIEVNGDPHRLDLPPEHLRRARAMGLRFALSADAHSDRGLDAARYAVMMARRGGIRRGQVVNTLPADGFAAAVHP